MYRNNFDDASLLESVEGFLTHSEVYRHFCYLPFNVHRSLQTTQKFKKYPTKNGHPSRYPKNQENWKFRKYTQRELPQHQPEIVCGWNQKRWFLLLLVARFGENKAHKERTFLTF